MQTLIKNGIVVDTEPQPVVIGRADVRIEDGRIAEVGPDLTAPDGAEVIDASRHIVMPGFVDSHRHTWQAAIRTTTADLAFAGYAERIFGQLGPAFQPEDVLAGNLAGALESLDAGVTTLLDWSHIQHSPEHTDAAVEALRASGIRAVFGYCHQGPLSELARETRRVRDAYFSSAGLVSMAFAALGPEIAPEEQALAELETARELDLPVTVHLGGQGPDSATKGLAFLESRGFLTPGMTFIHANHYSDEQFKVIAGTGGGVSVSPVDEMTLGMGYPVTGRAQAAGMPVSFSADTVTCAPGDMFSLMRTAYTLERGRPDGVGLGFTTRDVLRMATIDGARVVGLGDVTGSLRPGKQADLVLLGTDSLGLAASYDPIAAIVLNADTSAVDTVLVGGRVVKRDGRLVGQNVPAALDALAAAAGRVTAALV
ncbi:amidohydrolase family protein [Nonomuraea sp. SMC257]|uniref:Amidohydrolase family protein n=1 Tax=Nonomuraea montanisoli TaxID=2741721 RepID=A0A7Y6M090_9ACTN|nr:amidohydrolase family protein [Nonomuraea montanisoli]NUW30288.1 amidohydrolase family protein [Nonomuraea montanisoli]